MRTDYEPTHVFCQIGAETHKKVSQSPLILLKSMYVGVWRSWLARLHGVQEVVGSSPATPTIEVLVFANAKMHSVPSEARRTRWHEA